MTAPPESKDRRSSLAAFALFASAAAIAIRLWTSWCFLPLSGWNAVRLAPSFMLRFGPTPYPGLGSGPVTTWIYGPVPLFINLPATLAQTTATALLVAGTINLLVAGVPLAIAIFKGPSPLPETSGADRAWAFLLCLAVWPNASLQFLQADNTALAFGILANLILALPRKDPARPPLVAAACVALAVWSKQTMLGLVVAQLIWIGVSTGVRAAVRHAVSCLVCGLALGGTFIARFGFGPLWANLVQLPGRLPFWPGGGLDRTLGLLPHLLGYVVLPAAALIVWRRAAWRRDSPWLLPALSWLCLLPTSILSIYKIGGTANSLSGFIYLLLPAALATASVVRARLQRSGPVWLAASTIAIAAIQMDLSPMLPMKPLTGHLRRADFLAAQFPGQIYFPWNPLVTFFSDRRFYSAEDGLYVRYTAGLPPTRAEALRDLPPRWSITAFHGWPGGWGIVEHLQPDNAPRQQYGEWTLISWTPP